MAAREFTFGLVCVPISERFSEDTEDGGWCKKLVKKHSLLRKVDAHESSAANV